MRTFNQFITRRKIKNLKNWIEGMGFTSDDELATWCISQDIKPPDDGFFEVPAPPVLQEVKSEKPPQPVAKKPSQKKSAKGKDPTWVPAAERSRKVRGRKPEVKPKNKVDDDEEHTGTTKKSDTE